MHFFFYESKLKRRGKVRHLLNASCLSPRVPACSAKRSILWDTNFYEPTCCCVISLDVSCWIAEWCFRNCSVYRPCVLMLQELFRLQALCVNASGIVPVTGLVRKCFRNCSGYRPCAQNTAEMQRPKVIGKT